MAPSDPGVNAWAREKGETVILFPKFDESIRLRREKNMKTKNGYLWKYFLGVSLLVAVGVAQTLTDWSAPVNLGPTVNAGSGEL
ncbi:MAG: hypothetical protein A3J28_11865 [Acidobacteria bacterium RIFCSPLOWO2_12_FULL_60_22]|nr:MAG: hypothetical protein A3J28_11865 [Acidobacteria bacterium RIFCSPLOWO2_12_FULL_60_22]